MLWSIALAALAATQAVAQQPLNLTCGGGGTANKATARTAYTNAYGSGWVGTTPVSGSGSATTTVYGTRQQGFEEQVDVRLFSGDDRIRLPRTMLPGWHGGENGWFRLKDIVADARSIHAEAQVMLLYPMFFREITETDHLGFQFVPGLSTTGQVLAPLVREADARIGYLTDGDEGGTAIASQLLDAGVDQGRIVSLKNSDATAVEIEDFVDPTILLTAANRLIHLYHAEAAPLEMAQLSTNRRMASLEGAYLLRTGEPLPKVELAYEILKVVEDSPGTSVLDKRRRKAFEKVADRVLELFGGRTTSPQ